MPLQPGLKIGSYEILAPIGTNGQAGIYKASDSGTRRTLAIKTLPPHFRDRPELKQQFERELQTLATMEHPNICAFFALVHDEDGTDYVAMEYLEGETLAERLARGPLPLDEALKVGTAIASALDKAHRQGVIHRGLKPSNVMLTPAGAKLLNFGMANPNLPSPEPAAISKSMMPTASANIPGMIAGPTEYMAPEQLEAKAVDARTDIFAFGAVLYEMVTGKKAFEGKTPMLLTAAILTATPEPLSTAQPLAPPALDYIVKRCLAKDPRQRVQTAFDLMSQLQWIAESGTRLGVPAPVAAFRRKREKQIWIAAAVAALVAVVMALPAYRYVRGPAEPQQVRFNFGMGSGGTVAGGSIAISPDGRWIVTTSAAGASSRGLDALQSSSVVVQRIFSENNVTSPFWSADSRSIAFFEGGKLKKGEVAGGPTQIICDGPAPLGGGTWNSEGVILFASKGLIYRVLAAGGQPEAITTLDASLQETEHAGPYFLPDDRHYLYLAVSSQPAKSAIYLGALDSKERTKLIATESRAEYAAPGYILFGRGNTVFAQPFDAKKLKLTGEEIRVADGVPTRGTGPNMSPAASVNTAIFSASQTGVLAFRIGATSTGGSPASTAPDLSLVWFDRSGSRTGQVGVPGGYAGLDLSPGGKQVVVHRHEGAGGDSWILDTTAQANTQPQRLTFDVAQENTSPVWSRDGKQIAFASRRNGKWGLYVKPADGAATEQLITESSDVKLPMSWSLDDKMLVYVLGDPQTGNDIWAVPVTGDRKPIPIVQTPAAELQPQVSPDGKWIAYQSDQTSRPEIYIQPFPSGPGRWQVSTEGGQWPRWRGDSKELYFVQAPNVMAADIRVSGMSIMPPSVRVLFATGNPNSTGHATIYMRYAVTSDGQHFLVPQPGASAGASGSLADSIAALADAGGATNVGANAITVAHNWASKLKAK